MQDLIDKLKGMKNATQEQYDIVILKYSQSEVIKELKNAGISKDEINQEEFNELVQEKIKQAKSFSSGVLVATGAFLFLEFLG